MMSSKKKYFLGVDVGSITTKLAVIDETHQLIESVYIRTEGRPIQSVQRGMRILRNKLGTKLPIAGVGSTGSARKLTGLLIGADIIKNEITAHTLAALNEIPDVQTIIEIGGQDSKIIIVRDGIAVDFAMNTVCAAGTGAFLDHQAKRIGVPIEHFGKLALEAKNSVTIAGRCTVFAESDMIHKQQLGHPLRDIIKGLCEALTRNYLSNVAKGKEIRPPIIFQGGVAANLGIKKAFEMYLKHEIIVPKNHGVMGAIGAAILAHEEMEKNPRKSNFYGWDIPDIKFETVGFECKDCTNNCEVVKIMRNGELIDCWGSKCGKWDIQHKRTVTSEITYR